MARLTWRNMQAPDFRDVAAMQQNSGNLFAGGFSALGDIATGIDNKNAQAAAMQQKRMEEAMMQQALAGSDPTQDGNWARVMGAGPASMIGDMSAHLKDQQGQYDSRADRQNTRADTANVIVDTAANKFKLGQDVTAYNTGLEEKALQDKANQEMHELSLTFGSPENFKRAVEQMPGTFKEKELYRAAAEGVSSTNFNANPEGVSEFRSAPEFSSIQDTIRSEREAATFAKNADDTLRYYEMGLSTDGSETLSAQDALLEEARTVVGADEVPKYENSIGEMAREIKELSKDSKYKGIPKAVIIGIMREHVQSADSAFWSNETIETDMASVTSELDKLIAAKPTLSEDLANYQRQNEKLTEWEKKLQAEEARYGVAYDKTGKVGDRLRKDSLNNLNKLYEEVVGKPEPTIDIGSVSTPTTEELVQNPGSGARLIEEAVNRSNPLDNLGANSYYKENVQSNDLPESLKGTALFENAFPVSSGSQEQENTSQQVTPKDFKDAGLGEKTAEQYTSLLAASKRRALTSREQKFLDDVKKQLTQKFVDEANSILTGPGNR